MLAGLRSQREALAVKIAELNGSLRGMHRERKEVQKDLDGWSQELRELERAVFEEEVRDGRE